jgi:dTDP-4-amino-4,6-dideoxy-D-glucose acyltransferase
MAMLSREAIEQMDFASIGSNVQISDRASFYGNARISLGDHVRIDDFCVISAGQGGISIGNHVHIAIGASLIGAGRITLCDFVGVSSRTSIYSSNDDYSGAAMTGPTLPAKYTNVRHADVFLGKHVVVGSGCVILPGVMLEEGVAVGALSLVNRSCKAFGIYVGNPARRHSERKRDLLALEQQFLADQAR